MSLTYSSFYIQNDGTVKACGQNGNGQLGLGNTANKNIPTLIPNLDNVKQISCGYYHTVFLLNDGTVKVCGENSYGQLGLGDTTNRLTPILIPNLNNVKQISCGAYHTIFLLNDGNVKACGRNSYGQLGLGDTTNRLTPTLISDLNNVKQASCGYSHTVFLLNDCTAKSCGQNGNGQLGLGDATNRLTPILISNLDNVKQISCGGLHTLFLLNDGAVKVCGENSYGQLGLGAITSRNIPTLISDLDNVKQISCGYYHTVFLLNDCTAKSCGQNGNGQLGLGDATDRNIPTLISNLDNVEQISCGSYHTLFLLNDGAVKSSGHNTFGQLGLGNTASKTTPTLIPNLDNANRLHDIYDIIRTIYLLLKSNNKYYSILEDNYDDSSKMYNEIIITDINRDLETYGFSSNDLLKDVTINGETFKPIDKFSNFSIISSEERTYTINGIKNNKELIISNQNLSTIKASTIHNFVLDVTKTANGNIKYVISNDNGVTWKTWNGSSWDVLTNTCPLTDDNKVKQYSQLSDSEKNKWNQFKDEIWNNGIATDIPNIDYNTILTNKHIRFAFVLYRPSSADNVVLKNLSILYDKVGDWHKLGETDVDIAINTNSCSVTAKQSNLTNVKVNILI
jgi:alpha-tubulin suppressor-like RCC1 family protein/uncharacterized protein YbcV (DUF1398 family)